MIVIISLQISQTCRPSVRYQSSIGVKPKASAAYTSNNWKEIFIARNPFSQVPLEIPQDNEDATVNRPRQTQDTRGGGVPTGKLLDSSETTNEMTLCSSSLSLSLVCARCSRNSYIKDTRSKVPLTPLWYTGKMVLSRRRGVPA